MKIQRVCVFAGILILIVSNAFAQQTKSVMLSNNTPWQIQLQPMNCNSQGGSCTLGPMLSIPANTRNIMIACNFNFLKLVATNPVTNTPWPSTPLIRYPRSMQCSPFSIMWQCPSGDANSSESGNCLVIEH